MTTTTAPPVGPGGHSAPLGLMSCVRESSPQDLMPNTEIDVDRNETSKKRRFHPFRGLRKMFRRGGGGKVRNAGSEETVPVEGSPVVPDDTTAGTKDSHRSRSTSELLAGDEPTRRNGGGNGGNTGGMYPGGGALSVSHDSVFTAEQRSTRGDSTSSDLDTAQSSSSLSIQQFMQQTGVRAELLDVVRRRGRGRGDTSEDEEDLGLPRSPCNSPTTTDKALKEHPTKSHSTCSDGSLLSMGSSEMDEDSFGQHSRHSSKLSLHDRRPSQAAPDSELELGTAPTTAPLSHSAARHKMAVRPKRTHGAPRRRRVQQLTAGSALPTTPEVNEEVSTRSLTPESSAARETIAELYSSSSTSMSKVWNASSSVVSETQLKSASLPPGLALPTGSNKLSRSRSNAGTRTTKEAFAEEDESDDKLSKEEKKKEESFFGRFLARRSGKKKKSKSEDSEVSTTSSSTQIFSASKNMEKTETASSSYWQTEEKRTYSVDSGISKVARSGPAARQRIQPIDIPASPDAFRHRRQQQIDLDLPMPPPDNSPQEPSFLDASPPKKIPAFLPKQTKVTSPVSTSPEKSSAEAVPVPSPRTILPHSSKPAPEARTILPQPFSTPKSAAGDIVPAPRHVLPSLSPPKPTWPEKSAAEFVKPTDSKYVEKVEECKTKVKITGLSSYQQRVMSYNDELDNEVFKSLEDTSEDNTPPMFSFIKSQSFRSKSLLTSTQEHTSLPFTVNTSLYESNSDSETFTDSLMSSTNTYSSTAQSSDHQQQQQQVSVTVMKETESSRPMDLEGPDDNEVKIINTNAELSKETESNSEDISRNEIIDKPTPKLVNTSAGSSVTVSTDKEVSEEKLENKEDGITISCVNSQVQASVNTKSSNQVIVSISTPTESVISIQDQTGSTGGCSKTIMETTLESSSRETFSHEISSRDSSSREVSVREVSGREASTRETSGRESSVHESVSVTKVQLLKKESKQVESSTAQVPEFLKIQLNKVDAKPTTNVVLSTSSSFSQADEKLKQKSVMEIETDRENGEVVIDAKKRKFSTDDVEIVDKDISEELVEVPSKVTITNVHPTVKVTTSKISTSPKESDKQLPCLGTPKENDKKHVSSPAVVKENLQKESDKRQLPSSLPLNNPNGSHTRKSSLVLVSPASPTSNKPFLKKKSNSLELDSVKKTEEKLVTLASSSDQLFTKTESKDKTVSPDTQEPPSDVVIMRKKSLPQKRGDKYSDEPELMKVFARRSLKLKDSEAETLSQQVLVMMEGADAPAPAPEGVENGKRDSDKENECNESPPEERKKSLNAAKDAAPKPKEPLTESKFVETADVTLRKPGQINNKLSFSGSKYQRVTMPPPAIDSNDNSSERKNKSFIEPKTEKKPVLSNYRSHIMSIRDKDIDIKKSAEITKCNKTGDDFITKNDFENEDFVPMFKRIQQRKEEWEQRAQQNMKKSVP